MTDRFSRDLTISAIGHAVILALLLLRMVFVPSEPLEIRNAIRVDVVALPDKVVSEPAPVAKPEVKPPEPKAKTAAPEKPVVKKHKKVNFKASERQALAKLKAQAALEKIAQEVNQEKAKARAERKFKGNQVADGKSLTGLARIDYDRYVDDIQEKVIGAWSLPQWLQEADLKAQVLVQIDERGYVIKKVIYKSSGNDIFDSNALAAVEKGSPFPAPPARLRALLSTSGIIFRFPQ
jgi:TonB family protein